MNATTQSINAYRTTVSNWMHATPWMHNDLGKKHCYYTRSPEDEHKMAQTMSSLNQGQGYRSHASPSPIRAGLKGALVKDDGDKKQYLLHQIKENRRSMSTMSRQIEGKKNELLSLRKKITEFEQKLVDNHNTPKKNLYAAKREANNLEREMTKH